MFPSGCYCSLMLIVCHQSDDQILLEKIWIRWTYLFAGGLLSSGVRPRLASGDPGPAIIVHPAILLFYKFDWNQLNMSCFEWLRGIGWVKIPSESENLCEYLGNISGWESEWKEILRQRVCVTKLAGASPLSLPQLSLHQLLGRKTHLNNLTALSPSKKVLSFENIDMHASWLEDGSLTVGSRKRSKRLTNLKFKTSTN